MSRSGARIAARLVSVGAAVIVAVLAGEGGLRAAIDRLPIGFVAYMNRGLKDRVPESWTRLREFLPYLNLRQADETTGWTFKPGLHVSGVNEDGQRYDATMSAEGFFTPDRPDPAARQIVALGDSFLSIFYVPHPLAWQLRDALKTPVYLLAVHGWGPESYRAAYEKYAAKRNSPLVLVFTFFNDINDAFNWKAWEGGHEPGESYLTWVQKMNPDGDDVNTGASWLDAHSVAWNYLKYGGRGAGAKTAASLAPAVVGIPLGRTDPSHLEHFGSGERRFDLQFSSGLPFMSGGPETFVPGGGYYQYIKGYLESLDRLKQAIEAHGARMALVWVPSKERVYLPLVAAGRQASYLTGPAHDLDGLERVVTTYAAQAGVSLLDLTPSLAEHARAGEKLYFTVDGHLNDAGNVVAADAVATFVRQLPEEAPAPQKTGPQLFLTGNGAHPDAVLPASRAVVRAPLVSPSATGWRVKGTAESAFGYLLQWDEALPEPPRLLVMKGRVNRGGFTLGLIKNDKWALQMNVTSRGAFDIVMPVIEPGPYTVVVANCLYGDSRENDFDVAEFGWAVPR